MTQYVVGHTFYGHSFYILCFIDNYIVLRILLLIISLHALKFQCTPLPSGEHILRAICGVPHYSFENTHSVLYVVYPTSH